jgi:mevalonate kinase
MKFITSKTLLGLSAAVLVLAAGAMAFTPAKQESCAEHCKRVAAEKASIVQKIASVKDPNCPHVKRMKAKDMGMFQQLVFNFQSNSRKFIGFTGPTLPPDEYDSDCFCPAECLR